MAYIYNPGCPCCDDLCWGCKNTCWTLDFDAQAMLYDASLIGHACPDHPGDTVDGSVSGTQILQFYIAAVNELTGRNFCQWRTDITYRPFPDPAFILTVEDFSDAQDGSDMQATLLVSWGQSAVRYRGRWTCGGPLELEFDAALSCEGTSDPPVTIVSDSIPAYPGTGGIALTYPPGPIEVTRRDCTSVCPVCEVLTSGSEWAVTIPDDITYAAGGVYLPAGDYVLSHTSDCSWRVITDGVHSPEVSITLSYGSGQWSLTFEDIGVEFGAGFIFSVIEAPPDCSGTKTLAVETYDDAFFPDRGLPLSLNVTLVSP